MKYEPDLLATTVPYRPSTIRYLVTETIFQIIYAAHAGCSTFILTHTVRIRCSRRHPFSLTGRLRLFQFFFSLLRQTVCCNIVSWAFGSLRVFFSLLFSSFDLFFLSLWSYTTSPETMAIHSPPGGSNLVAPTEKHRHSSENIRCALQLLCQTKSFLLKACSTKPDTKKRGTKQIVEIPFSTTRILQVFIVYPLGILHNTDLSITVVDKEVLSFTTANQKSLLSRQVNT